MSEQERVEWVDGDDVCTWYYDDGTMMKSHVDDVVLEGFACPECGERRMDCLLYCNPDDDTTVTCQTCGTAYEVA